MSRSHLKIWPEQKKKENKQNFNTVNKYCKQRQINRHENVTTKDCTMQDTR